MPTSVFPAEGVPAPGEPLTSLNGALTAVVHKDFPGVLLRLVTGSDFSWLPLLRYDVAVGEWVTVRTGGPMWIEGRKGYSYDLEAEPGRTYIYRPGYSYGTTDPAPYEVLVTLPPYDFPTDVDAWLKHLDRPGLSMRVRIAAFAESSESWLSSASIYSGGRYATDGRAIQMPTGSLSLWTETEAEYRALRGTLEAPGVLLFQPCPGAALDPMYFRRGALRPDRLEPGWGMRTIAFDWVAQARPDWRADLDQPVTIPGWSWDDYTAGHTWETLAQAYPSEWDALLAGVRQWNPRGGADAAA